MNHIYPWPLCLWCQVLLAGAKVALYVHTKQLAGAMGVSVRIFIEAVAVYCQSTQEVRLVRFNSAH